VAAIIKGRSIEEALQWAPINSMSVVQKVGAQAGLLTEKELEHYLRNAPHGYHPRRME
jgi:sugar/nucleoside kinase (ribokinase family)